MSCTCELCSSFEKHIKELERSGIVSFFEYNLRKKIEFQRIKKKRKLKNLPKLGPRNKLVKFAQSIEKKNYKSDLWLKREWRSVQHPEDKFNSPEGYFIPDLINRKFKYIIECDGSIHGLKEQKERDQKKDEYYRSKGFYVFRVDFMDFSKLEVVKLAVQKVRGF